MSFPLLDPLCRSRANLKKSNSRVFASSQGCWFLRVSVMNQAPVLLLLILIRIEMVMMERNPFVPSFDIANPNPTPCIFHSLCHVQIPQHSNNIFLLDRLDSATYVIMFYLYALAGKWDEACLLNEEDALSDFTARKEQLLGHSERLAIAYGLICTAAETPIMVFRNTRSCKDSHDFAKRVSIVTGRELVVRDATRFHHINSGNCSCRAMADAIIPLPCHFPLFQRTCVSPIMPFGVLTPQIPTSRHLSHDSSSVTHATSYLCCDLNLHQLNM
ncbi:Pentatricopeptide repeat-containing protein [Vigna angularis]|uniref:Pentatricopeptide repeat-containing protein n=1 Tax=Phaseolus angularis TaxID=3914 RepID=A0A8T0KTY1_PHAAN|nr:Pentatricopeptide repeat-containing protein [Vigna angularis]